MEHAWWYSFPTAKECNPRSDQQLQAALVPILPREWYSLKNMRSHGCLDCKQIALPLIRIHFCGKELVACIQSQTLLFGFHDPICYFIPEDFLSKNLEALY